PRCIARAHRRRLHLSGASLREGLAVRWFDRDIWPIVVILTGQMWGQRRLFDVCWSSRWAHNNPSDIERSQEKWTWDTVCSAFWYSSATSGRSSIFFKARPPTTRKYSG